MQKILAIALFILCITARKHHKQEIAKSEAQLGCLRENCMDQASNCYSDDQCTQTMEICDQDHVKNITLDDLVSCTANNEIASAFAVCMRDNCAIFETFMRFFKKRN